jgi:hypothetical protein
VLLTFRIIQQTSVTSTVVYVLDFPSFRVNTNFSQAFCIFQGFCSSQDLCRKSVGHSTIRVETLDDSSTFALGIINSRAATSLDPDAMAVERLVREKGLFSFYQDGHQERCGIRKVGPLRRRLQSLDAWVGSAPLDCASVNLVHETVPVYNNPEQGLPGLRWPRVAVRDFRPWRYHRGSPMVLGRPHRLEIPSP